MEFRDLLGVENRVRALPPSLLTWQVYDDFDIVWTSYIFDLIGWKPWNRRTDTIGTASVLTASSSTNDNVASVTFVVTNQPVQHPQLGPIDPSTIYFAFRITNLEYDAAETNTSVAMKMHAHSIHNIDASSPQQIRIVPAGAQRAPYFVSFPQTAKAGNTPVSLLPNHWPAVSDPFASEPHSPPTEPTTSKTRTT